MAAVATSRAERYRADGYRLSLRLALLVATAIAAGFALWIQAELRAANPDLAGFDTWAYWALDPQDPYTLPPTWQRGTFLYGPPVAQAIAPLSLLPWEVVRDAWGTAQIGLLVALRRTTWHFRSR